MRYPENENLHPENEEEKPTEETKDETPEEDLEEELPEEEDLEEEDSEEETPEAPEIQDPEPPKREEPPRDIYGRTYTSYTPPKAPEKPKKQGVNMSGGALALLLVCCMLVSLLAGAGINYLFEDPTLPSTSDTTTNSSASDTADTSNGDTNSEQSSTGTGETAPSITIGVGSVIGSTDFPDYERYAAVANDCIRSVVIINVTEPVISYGQEYESMGAGSGVIYTEDGYIVTNYHVANENSKTIKVELYDGTTYDAKYIYGDEYADIAVVKIEKNDCIPAKIGDSTQMALGQMVVAIGNPLGYGLTVTDGLVSALSRSVTVENTTMLLMQTSASINSGNSGGGLFNMNGELIGIVNAKIGGTSVEGMGYAIPSATVVKCVNDLKNYGYITGKARLGVTVQTKQYQTWPYLQTYSYTQVTEIDPDGSAAKSGLKVGDILYKFNDKEISSFEVLSEQLTRYKVGDTVTITVRRPTIELTSNNLSEYLSTAEEIKLTVTFVEFNPNA